MVEEIYKNIYRIGVALPGNPLKELNSYFIKGVDDDHDLLIDTGFRRPVCRQALEDGLRQLGSEDDRRQMLVTHLHSDHSGMADIFAGKNQPIYLTGMDIKYLSRFYSGELTDPRHDRFTSEGFTGDLLNEMYRINPAMTEKIPEMDRRFRPLSEGETISVGEYVLQTVSVPGHTPGNAMFYMKDQKIMFTGDHVLFDISPNITWWPDMEDSLGSYLDSLKKALDYDVDIAFPGHRHSGNYRVRIKELLKHHEKRLENAVSIIRDHPGMNAYDITGLMKWKIHARNWDEFPIVQKWFAVGECLAHLDYLCLRGRIRKEKDGDTWRYFVCQTGR